MRDEDLKYFSEFLSEFQSETDRGAALVGAALIDDRLDRVLRSHLIESKESAELLDGGMAPLGSLSARAKLTFCLGLITELEYREADLIRRIRNEFAHAQHGLSFSDKKLNALCGNLQANTPDGKKFEGNPRQLFINSVILLSLSLWYRPEYARGVKAQQQNWGYELQR